MTGLRLLRGAAPRLQRLLTSEAFAGVERLSFPLDSQSLILPLAASAAALAIFSPPSR